MAKQKLDYKKIALTFIGFGTAKLLFDYLTQDSIDYHGVIAIPMITIALVFLVDKKRFMSNE